MINSFKLALSKLKNNKNIAMPLKEPINASTHNAPFFRGKNISIQQGCIISDDSEIYSNTYIGFNVYLTKVKIATYCSIANNVAIGLGEHKLDSVSTCALFYDDIYSTLSSKVTTLMADVWIGQNAIVRQGVTVGTGAVVGAMSFVNEDVPPYAVVVGSPAKIIKYRFTPKQIAILLDSKWWELPIEKAKPLLSELQHKLLLAR